GDARWRAGAARSGRGAADRGAAAILVRAGGGALMGRQMLVIDDSLTIRKLVELSFRDQDWAIEFATTGAEGAAKAVSCAPDLILLDFVLPDMKATEVCRRLACDQTSAQRPVILMSAKMESVRELFKPFPMVV